MSGLIVHLLSAWALTTDPPKSGKVGPIYQVSRLLSGTWWGLLVGPAEGRKLAGIHQVGNEITTPESVGKKGAFKGDIWEDMFFIADAQWNTIY